MPELTPQEKRCVLLAGDGLSDKEIAGSLSIGYRTVGNNLHRAYQKLGVSDRKLAARRLSNDYSEQPLLISPSPSSTPDRGVAAGHQQDPDADLDRRLTGLLKAYANLGSWRLPPRWGGRRIGPIVVWAVLLLVLLGIGGQSLRSCAELLDVVRGRPLITSTGADRLAPR